MPTRRERRLAKFLLASTPSEDTTTSVVAAGAPVKRGVVQTLLASARTLTTKRLKRSKGTIGGWQDEAYALYDQVGELHFVTNSIASAVSGCTLYVATKNATSGSYDKVEDSSDPAVQALEALWGDSPTGMSQLLRRIGQQLFVTGESFLVGMPEEDDEDDPDVDPSRSLAPADQRLRSVAAENAETVLPLDTLCWSAHARGEMKIQGSQVKLGERTLDIDEIVVIRIWRSHPRAAEESDSAVRSSMPVCRELVGLTMHVSAQVDSRLAGAGVFVVPQSATILGTPAPEDEKQPESFLESLMTAMITPIKDRDSAAAVVPVVIQVPDEAVGLFQFISFATPLDGTAKELRDEAIRRLALGLDAPPERLMGMGDTNHWGAWQLAEDEVKLHIEPLLDLIRDALTVAYIRVVLTESNVTDDPGRYVVLADTSELTLRPDRSADGFQLYDRDELDGDALRDATGFEPEDAPSVEDRALAMALKVVTANPALFADPGLFAVKQQIVAALLGIPDPAIEVAARAEPQPQPAGGAPDPNAPTPTGTPPTQGAAPPGAPPAAAPGAPGVAA